MTYDVEFVSSERCGEDLLSAWFTRPAGFDFRAGQWVSLALETPTGEQRRTFSLSSAPGDDGLQITTRISGSEFKQALAALTPGGSARIAGPGGRMVLDDGVTRVAFLAGGTGISPIRSILRDRVQRGVVFEDALLFYGSRDPDCAVFHDEILSLESAGVRVVPVYEHAPASWEGERGFVTARTVRRHWAEDDGRVFVTAGPPPMVAAMELVMDELAISQERRIVERFGPVEREAGS